MILSCRREAISQDVDGENYPWSTQHIYDLLNTDLYKDVSGTIVPGSSLKVKLFINIGTHFWSLFQCILVSKLQNLYTKAKNSVQ